MRRLGLRLLIAVVCSGAALASLNHAVRVVREGRQPALEALPAYRAYQERLVELRRYAAATRRPAQPHRREHIRGASFNLRGIRFRYNAAGMRVNREFPRRPPTGVRRVALLSDSVGQGLYVPLEHACARVMERAFAAPGRPEVQALNFAVDGFETFDEYHVLERRALDHAPDAVVLLVCLNDLFDRTRVSGGDAAAGGRLERWRASLPLLDFTLDRLEHHPPAGGLPAGVHWDVFAENFRAIAGLARRRNVHLVAGVAPLYPVEGNAPYRVLEERVLGLARAEGAGIADLRAAFAAARVPPDTLFPAPGESFLYPRDHWHPAAAGHALMGRALADAVLALPRW